MKGTFFSADFIKDKDENLRLLELNTDTAIVETQVQNLDFTSIIDHISSSNITDVEVIYKPVIHQRIVNKFSESLDSSDVSVTFNEYPEDKHTIYPITLADDSSKFILRIAYDESAIFDSTYAKERLNVFKLFYDDTDTTSRNYITQFYHSSSDATMDTLGRYINPETQIPDVAIKDTNELHNPIDFYKIGSSSMNDTDRWNAFVSEHEAPDKLIEQYHYHSSSISPQGEIQSYRSFYIVYGTDLAVTNLLSYKNKALFSLPTAEPYDTTSFSTTISNKIPDYHYYEFTTNALKIGGAGLLSTDKIQMADETHKALSDVLVGDSIKSFYVSGSPQVESEYDIMNWRHNGSSFPSGSYITSSEVIFKNTVDLKYNALIEYVVDGDTQYSGPSKQFLVFDSSSGETIFRHATELNHNYDYFYDYQGNLIDLDAVNYYITSDSNVQLVELDVEDTDTYIISGSTAFNQVVSHNNPCFVAGTKVTLSDGSSKNIEDISIGMIIQTFHHQTNTIQNKIVKNIMQKTVNKTVKYTFEDGKVLESTLDHPIYSVDNGTGYVSYDPKLTLEGYGLEVGQVQVGTNILLESGTTLSISNIEVKNETVKVYNIHDIQDNHNFFANQLLVHNRCFVAGTQISMEDGSTKNIEDVQVGEKVLTYNEQSGEQEAGVVGDLKQHEVTSVIRLTLDNENIIITTEEHPFFIEGKGWVKAGEIEVLDVCKKVDGSESLISTVEKLDETHMVYNLLSVSDNHNFYANGILVHNK
jgi:hypothetical protein